MSSKNLFSTPMRSCALSLLAIGVFCFQVHGQGLDSMENLYSQFACVDMDSGATKLPENLFNLDSILALPSGGVNAPVNLDSFTQWSFYRRNISPEGSISLESFATNYQDPFTLSEKMYTRIYGSPGITLGNLPFRVDFFLTTEPNTLYNSNNVNLSFDVEQFKNKLRDQKMQSVASLASKKQVLGTKKSQLEVYKEELDTKLSERLLQLDSFTDLVDSYQVRSHINTTLTDKLPDTTRLRKEINSMVNPYSDSLQHQADSNFRYRSTIYIDRRDSLHKTREEVLTQYHQKQAEIELLRKRIDQVDSVLTTLKNIDSVIGVRTEQLTSNATNPTRYRVFASRNKKLQKLISLFDKIETLELGINYPVINQYSINGIPTKGVNLSFNHKNNRLQYVGGKTINTLINTFGLDQPGPEFTRNVHALAWSHRRAKTEFKVSTTTMWDNANDAPAHLNLVQTLDYAWQVTQRVNLSLGSAHSTYDENRTSNSETPQELSIFQSQLYQSAFHSELRARLDGKSKLKVRAERIYPGFMNLANPFMRSGYDQIDAKIDRKFFKRRLHVAGSYKHFQDNILGNNQGTNTMQGYGFSMRTALKKYPNVFIQHNPYEQGNNHPDSLFRTNTQLSVTSVGVIYTKKGTKGVTNILGSATRSYIDFNKPEEVPVENRFFTLSANTQRKTLRMGLNAYRNTSLPSVDTLNYSGVRIDLEKTVKKTMKLTCSAFGDLYDSGSYRYLTTLGVTYVKKKTSVTLNGSVGEVHKLFGLDQKRVLSCGMIVHRRL